MADAARIRLDVIQHACSRKCMGHPGNNGGCCKLGPRDYIIGPVVDVEALVEHLSERLGRPVARQDVVIDFDEGRKLFPERTSWQNPSHFPALRIRTQAPFACSFHDDERGCTIHEIRPQLCRRYECSWLRDAVDALL